MKATELRGAVEFLPRRFRLRRFWCLSALPPFKPEVSDLLKVFRLLKITLFAFRFFEGELNNLKIKRVNASRRLRRGLKSGINRKVV